MDWPVQGPYTCNPAMLARVGAWCPQASSGPCRDLIPATSRIGTTPGPERLRQAGFHYWSPEGPPVATKPKPSNPPTNPPQEPKKPKGGGKKSPKGK